MSGYTRYGSDFRELLSGDSWSRAWRQRAGCGNIMRKQVNCRTSLNDTLINRKKYEIHIDSCAQCTLGPLKVWKHNLVNSAPPKIEASETNTHKGSCYHLCQCRPNENQGQRIHSIWNYNMWALLPVSYRLSHRMILDHDFKVRL